MDRERDIGFAVRRLSNLIKRDIEKSRGKLGIDPVKGVNGWATIFTKTAAETFSKRILRLIFLFAVQRQAVF